jgi:hypothetical protein
VFEKLLPLETMLEVGSGDAAEECGVVAPVEESGKLDSLRLIVVASSRIPALHAWKKAPHVQ